MTYFTAQDIKTAEKFFGHRIYIDFGKNGKYADECEYEDLNDYVFCEFAYGEDENGTPEINVEVKPIDELYDEYEYDEDGNCYEGGEMVFDINQGYITFEDIVCDMIVPYNFNIDAENKKITVA